LKYDDDDFYITAVPVRLVTQGDIVRVFSYPVHRHLVKMKAPV